MSAGSPVAMTAVSNSSAVATLHNRVVTTGLPTAHAIAVGTGGRGRVLAAADATRGTGSKACRTGAGAANAVETAALMAHEAAPPASRPSHFPREKQRQMVGAAGFEPTTLRPPGDTAFHESPDERDKRIGASSAVATRPDPRGTDVAADDVPDAVEAALADALSAASKAGEWATVAQLARELETRRAGRSAAAIVNLDAERARRSAR